MDTEINMKPNILLYKRQLKLDNTKLTLQMVCVLINTTVVFNRLKRALLEYGLLHIIEKRR